MTHEQQRYRIETRAIHAGEPETRLLGSVVPPIFQSNLFEYEGTDPGQELVYPRLNNLPNHKILGAKLASLENGESALVTASGMAAITASLITTLGPGGHLLADHRLYGGTFGFINAGLPELGMSADFIDGNLPDTWAAKLRPTTRAIYVETLTNPLIRVPDLLAVVRFARDHGLTALIDNTLATPVNFRPLDHGFDLSLHSATKYLNGHSDVVAGAVIGSKARVDKIRECLNRLGGSLDAHACFLLHRGLKTLPLRVRHQSASAAEIAAFLDRQPRVRNTHHPSLAGHPEHLRARELFSASGGLLAFELDADVPGVERFLRSLALFAPTSSLGGVESLVVFPARTSHVGMSAEARARAGVSDGLLRVSVGLEATADLIEDLEQALRAL